MSQRKTCSKCGKRKSASRFYNQTRSRDGLSSHCKDCMDAARARNRQRMAAAAPEPPAKKRCRKCGTTKPSRDFSTNKSSSDGLYAYCKACKAAMVQDHRDRNRDTINKKARMRSATPEGRRKVRDGNLKSKFGITHSDFERMLRKQGGVCAICHQAPVAGEKHFAVDHCHNTPAGEPLKLRGILCAKCNRALGLAQDDASLLKSAVTYLRKHSKRTDANV